MALGMVLWNKKGIVLSADIKGTFPCREFKQEDIFQELELGKEIYKYYIYKDKYAIIHPGLIEGNPVGLDLFEQENPNLDLTDMVMILASCLEKRALPKRKYDYFVAGYVGENQYVYHIEVADTGVTINCKLNSEANVMLLGCSDIAKNILYTAFNLVDLKDMTENEMIAVSRNIYLMSSEMQKDLRGVKTVGRMCNIISLTPDSVKVKFIEN